MRPGCLQQRHATTGRPCCPLGRASRREARASAALVENSTSAPSKPESNGDGAQDVEEPEKVYDDAYTIANLSLEQVQELISTVSEETDIAEVHLKLNDVEVKFRRTAGNMPVPAAPVAMAMPADSVAADEAAVPADTLTDAASMDTDTEDATLTLVPVTSVKVGTFRRCRYVNTKQVGKTPIVTSGSGVKAGQALAFIEQLGTFSPVEAPMNGEVVNVLLEEGDPVAYDQELFELNPSMASSGSRIK